MEVWVESFEAFCSSTILLTEAIEQYHHTTANVQANVNDKEIQESNQTNKLASSQASFSISNVNSIIQPAVKKIFIEKCLKPVNNMLSFAPSINEQVQERKTILLDFDSYKAKLQKEQSTTKDPMTPSLIKKLGKLEESSKKLNTLNNNIFQTFEEFEIARPLSLSPSLSVFIGILYSYYSIGFKETMELLPKIPQTAVSVAVLDYKYNSLIHSVREKYQISLKKPLQPNVVESLLDLDDIDVEESSNSRPIENNVQSFPPQIIEDPQIPISQEIKDLDSISLIEISPINNTPSELNRISAKFVETDPKMSLTPPAKPPRNRSRPVSLNNEETPEPFPIQQINTKSEEESNHYIEPLSIIPEVSSVKDQLLEDSPHVQISSKSYDIDSKFEIANEEIVEGDDPIVITSLKSQESHEDHSLNPTGNINNEPINDEISPNFSPEDIDDPSTIIQI